MLLGRGCADAVSVLGSDAAVFLVHGLAPGGDKVNHPAAQPRRPAEAVRAPRWPRRPHRMHRPRCSRLAGDGGLKSLLSRYPTLAVAKGALDGAWCARLLLTCSFSIRAVIAAVTLYRCWWRADFRASAAAVNLWTVCEAVFAVA